MQFKEKLQIKGKHMNFYIKNKETGSRWEFEVDVDKSGLKDLLESDEWDIGPGEDIITEDWTQRARGYDVFGFEDNELEEYVNELRGWFEDQGVDTEYSDFIPGEKVASEEEELELEEFDSGTEDIFDKIFDGENVF